MFLLNHDAKGTRVYLCYLLLVFSLLFHLSLTVQLSIAPVGWSFLSPILSFDNALVRGSGEFFRCDVVRDWARFRLKAIC